MIIKPFEARPARGRRNQAGVRAEKDMAHYLDRYFKDSNQFLLLHDLQFTYEGENGQIDHLVIHRFGLAIVESKSVTSKVRVNAASEWDRFWNGKWQGMADPLLQAERQGMLLKKLLNTRTPDLLDKVLLGAFQGTFRNMAIDTFAAISVDGVIERAKGRAPSAMKADAIPGAIEALVSRYQLDSRAIGSAMADFNKAPRSFKDEELKRIGYFLLAHHRANQEPRAEATEQPEAVIHEDPSRIDENRSGKDTRPVSCKKCASTNLTPLIGRYGPYMKCADCEGNTSVRASCATCASPVKLVIEGPGFAGSCANCGGNVEIIAA